MKLNRPCQHSAWPAAKEIGGYRPGFFGWLFRLPIIKARLEYAHKAPDPHANSTCWIDFEDSPCTVGVKHHTPVAFGNILYTGITPLKHQYENIYECTVEHIQHIRLEKYEPLDHFYM